MGKTSDAVAEGVSIASAAARLTVRNHILVETIAHDESFDPAQVAPFARETLIALAAEQEEAAALAIAGAVAAIGWLAPFARRSAVRRRPSSKRRRGERRREPSAFPHGPFAGGRSVLVYRLRRRPPCIRVCVRTGP